MGVDDDTREEMASDSEEKAPEPGDEVSVEPREDHDTAADERPSVSLGASPGSHVPSKRLTSRNISIGLALAGLCALLGVEVVYIAKSNPTPVSSARPDAGNAPAPAVIAQQQESDAATQDVPAMMAVVPAEASASPDVAFSEEGVSDEESPAAPKKPKHFKTVQEASIGSCSTSSVDGLSRQVIEQVRCTNPSAFAPLPQRPNLILDEHIFPYLELNARDHLLKVLDANRKRTLTVHSALRTVAQQYLVWRWSASRRCGVQMATPPGSSNHETGRALDIADQAQWRAALEAQDFHWLGAADLVHFDYKSNRAQGLAPDVLAFQRLWNRNHPDDRVAETGRYDTNTEQRLKKSPPGGFAIGPSCAKKKSKTTASR